MNKIRIGGVIFIILGFFFMWFSWSIVQHEYVIYPKMTIMSPVAVVLGLVMLFWPKMALPINQQMLLLQREGKPYNVQWLKLRLWALVLGGAALGVVYYVWLGGSFSAPPL